MLLAIDPDEPEPWLVARAAAVLRRGGVVVLPTDTVYSLTCSLTNAAAVERLYAVKGVSQAKRMSILVSDIATASRFTRGIPNRAFRAMRRVLPGPYTFIFEASSEVPKVMLHKRRSVGIRIPAAPLVHAVIAELGEPLLATSVRNGREEWLLDPIVIEEELGGGADLVVDGGMLANEPSTVIDLSGDHPALLRQGKGDFDELDLID